MFPVDRDNDTICALASGHGRSGISVIRVSGSKAAEFSRKLCVDLPEVPESHRAYFSNLRFLENGEILDQAVLTFFLVRLVGLYRSGRWRVRPLGQPGDFPRVLGGWAGVPS